MKKIYSIGEAASLAGMTVETLRHYDRIGLLKPAKVDKQSGYRYYTDEELVYLEVIGFYRKNHMSLKEIKNIFEQDFMHIVAFLKKTEKKIDEEICRLNQTKEQISNVRKQLKDSVISVSTDFEVKYYQQRAIILADNLYEANIENFSRLYDELYTQLGDRAQEKFQFDNSAYLFVSQLPNTRFCKMFSVCTKFEDNSNLQFLQEGNYLCFTCSKEEKEEAIQKGLLLAKEKYNSEPDYAILKVQFTGMFQWRYEVQIPLT